MPGPLRHARAAVLASGLLALAGVAGAAIIDNTASVMFTGPAGPATLGSNVSSLNTLPTPSPAVVTFYQYAPGAAASTSLPFDGGFYDFTGGGIFSPLPAPQALDGSTIPLSGPVPVRPTSVYHINEPIFVSLADANRNTDPALREYIEITLTTTAGDTEVLRLQETGADTGVFAAVIQSADPSQPMASNNGRLTVGINTRLTVNYQDPIYLDDTSTSAALVDPFGFVFDSITGAPLNGVRVALLNADTGLPAMVFGDDGVSTYPTFMDTGSTVTDSSGQVYNLPAGGFRFPFVPPGNYRFVVTPVAGYTVPSTVPVGSLPNDLAGNPYAVVGGSRGEVFVVVPGPALNIDIPADPNANGLFLQKSVSRQQASAGDFLQYRLNLQNLTISAAPATTVTDRLPAGMRYEAGSLRLNGQLIAHPGVSADGRTLTFGIGILAPGGTAQISYVVQLGAGVQPGDAVNTASAIAAGGALNSNAAQVSVRVTEPLMSSRATLIGRVFEGDCNTPWQELKGVANARVLLEDGTYVVTDQDGQYHFKGVRPGTHVVQLDVDTLPAGLEAVSCIENTRFAGRSFSQFVDVKGGALWRADFHTRARRGAIGIRLQSRLALQDSTRATPASLDIGQSNSNIKNFTLRAEFDSCRATLKPEGEASLDDLIGELSGADIQRIELIGNTDEQRMSARCRQLFNDNHKLSEARARTVGDALAARLFLPPDQVRVSGRGADAPVASNKTPEGRARNRRTEIRVFLNKASGETIKATAVASADVAKQVSSMTHRIEVDGNASVSNLKIMAMLPDDAAYHRGTARIDGKPVTDPAQTEGLLTFPLGAETQSGETRVIEFDTYPLATHAVVAPGIKRYTLRARFESCSDAFHATGQEAIDAVIAELRSAGKVDSIELTGYSDNQSLSASCQQRFPDNQKLSLARARTAGQALARALELKDEQISVSGRGTENALADNATPAGRARNRRIEITVRMADDLAAITQGQLVPVDCPDKAYSFRAVASFEASGRKRNQTPPVETRIGCPAVATDVAAPVSSQDSSERRSVEVTQFGVVKALPPELQARVLERQAVRDDVGASGGSDDWLTGQAAGIDWLFPGPDHNPRAPAVRIVIKHLPGQTVILKRANGEAVSALNYDGIQVSGDQSVAVSVWRGVPLVEGENAFKVEIQDKSGEVVQELRRSVHYGNSPMQAVLLPEKSILLADGLNKPVLAVRFLDRDGRPVRAGVTGPISIGAPYRSWQEVEQEQNRQLAGMDRFEPQYTVEGDDGIAYIELAPTTDSGTVQLDVRFQLPGNSSRRQELRAWLEPAARDWVVVGFAEGTLGYNTLKDNSQSLSGKDKDGGYSDGQVSLYAKGRVLGKWLLTMSYDTDKNRNRGQSLLGTIDPNEFYTLYGDGTEQRYDAASQEKLYLKLERGQFYALFGDYNTGLTQTQLSRYNRTLNGLKSENGGGPVVFTVFAAETPQNFARDEFQGDGTSGLYRLAQRGIVLNSEKIRIETRDRLRSEKILGSKQLTRHIDYDIDYSNGTLFFRQPIASRDTSFNPIFIVSEYETLGVASRELNAGGRVGLKLKEGRVEVGVTAIHDETNLNSSDLAGTDIKVRVGKDSEVRVEAAQTKGQIATLSPEGMAWLTEFEHHNGKFDALVYARRQEPGFGLNQQNLSEAGQQKVGAEGQWRLNPDWSVNGNLYQQENLGSQTTRDAVQGKLQYATPAGGFSVGAQIINDQTDSGALAGQDFRSEQATVAANRFFLNRKLELSAQAETALAGQSDSVDFPDRYMAGASFALNDHVRLLGGQEFTDGGAFNTTTTRVGLQVTPWKGAKLDSTLNQSQMSEYGPRTFGQFGLTQGLVLNDRWGMDVSLDSSQTLKETTQPVLVLNPAYPVAAGGGPGGTEDFIALSTGASYRTPQWSWNGRAENRDGETSDRHGLVSNFLRQAQAGVAFASSAQLFRTQQSSGSEGWLSSVDLSWAWRPLGVQWSLLDRLEFRFEDVDNGSGVAGSGLFGNTSLVATSASTRRIINNFALNRVSREWSESDRQGNLFRRYERNQWSLYYGAKYVMDSFDGMDYSGYTDLIGTEVRHDLKSWLDVGVQASALNSWSLHSHAYSFGPQVGVSPVTNGWITLGWNLRGFTDSDFDAARYTAQGPYLQLRFKFDQNTRLGLGKSAAPRTAGAPE